MPMQRWIASAAGGASQRLKPGPAMIRSRSSKRAGALCSLIVIPAIETSPLILCFAWITSSRAPSVVGEGDRDDDDRARQHRRQKEEPAGLGEDDHDGV